MSLLKFFALVAVLSNRLFVSSCSGSSPKIPQPVPGNKNQNEMHVLMGCLSSGAISTHRNFGVGPVTRSRRVLVIVTAPPVVLSCELDRLNHTPDVPLSAGRGMGEKLTCGPLSRLPPNVGNSNRGNFPSMTRDPGERWQFSCPSTSQPISLC